MLGAKKVVRLGVCGIGSDGALEEFDRLIGLVAVAGSDGEVQQFFRIEVCGAGHGHGNHEFDGVPAADTPRSWRVNRRCILLTPGELAAFATV